MSSQVRSGQVKSSQAMSGQVRSGQVRSSQVKSSQVKSSQVKSSQVKSSQVKSSQVKSSQAKSSQAKSGQVRSSQGKSSQAKPSHKSNQSQSIGHARAVTRICKISGTHTQGHSASHRGCSKNLEECTLLEVLRKAGQNDGRHEASSARLIGGAVLRERPFRLIVKRLLVRDPLLQPLYSAVLKARSNGSELLRVAQGWFGRNRFQW